MRSSFATWAGYSASFDKSSIMRHATGFDRTRICATSRNTVIFFAEAGPSWSGTVTSDFRGNSWVSDVVI